MPSCPPGTVQVGIISVKGPDGEEGCVICKDCDYPKDPECLDLDCCTPEQIAEGRECKAFIDFILYKNGNFFRSIRTDLGGYELETIDLGWTTRYDLNYTTPCGISTSLILYGEDYTDSVIVEQPPATSCFDCS